MLWQFRMGGGWQIYPKSAKFELTFSMCWYFLISSYYLTVLNGRSLTALKSVEVTQCSGSFEWGGLADLP